MFRTKERKTNVSKPKFSPPRPAPIRGSAQIVHVVISTGENETTNIFSSRKKATEFMDKDNRIHICYDYLIDCPEYHESKMKKN